MSISRPTSLLASALLVAALLACASARGPLDAVLTGRVVAADGHPLAGATLVLPEHRLQATSDSSGQFAIAVSAPPGQIKLVVRSIGYTPTLRRLNLRRSGALVIGDIVLQVDIDGIIIDTVTRPRP